MRAVYNGYEEKFMTGKEIKDYFRDAYSRFGRHHERISSYHIKIDTFKRLEDEKKFRLFINDSFCAIFDKQTDNKLYFIAYTKERPKWAKE